MKIHYAIEIDTEYTDTIPEIGMIETGKIKYITDGMDTTGMTYEDGTPVSGFNSTLLVKDGISSSMQKIDIIAGGDYSYSASLDVSIANTGLPDLLSTQGLFIVGSAMTMYVVIDGTFYSRWAGVVGSYEFNEKIFKFKGVDKHKIDNKVIKEGDGVGYTYIENKIDEDDIELLNDGCFIKNVQGKESIMDFMYNDGYYGSNQKLTGRKLDTCLGVNCREEKKILTNISDYVVMLNGWYNDIKVGQYLKFKGDDKYFRISDINHTTLQYEDDDGDSINTTELTIQGMSDSLIEFSQFYGRQEKIMGSTYKDDMATAHKEKIYVSIHSITVPTLDDEYEYVIKDGKYVSVDDDCNEVLVDIDQDGNVLYNTDLVTTIKPSKIYTFTKDHNAQFNTDLEAGKVTHLENEYSEITIPNNNNLTDDSYVSPPANQHYFVAEFNEPIDDGYTPYAIVDALVDAWENWFVWELHTLWERYTSFARSDYVYDRTAPLQHPWQPTSYDQSIWGDDEQYMGSWFRFFTIEVYSILEDKDAGEVPLLIGDFTLPNIRNREEIVQYVDDIEDKDLCVGLRVKSSKATNIPQSAVVDNDIEFISTYTSTFAWKDYVDSEYYSDKFRPVINEVLKDFQNTMVNTSDDEVFTTYGVSKLMFRIKPNNDTTNIPTHGSGVIKLYPNGRRVKLGMNTATDSNGLGVTEIPIGVNSLGLYKTSPIDINTLKLKVKPKDNMGIKTYPELLRDFTGSTSMLSLKDSWYVGKYYNSEVNTFDEVTKLCKQGFTAGFSDRSGNIVLKDFLNSKSNVVTHTDELILDKSLKNFKLSSLSKCYNDFTIKYDYRCGDYQGEYGVHHVDEDAFPEPYLMDPNSGNPTPYPPSTDTDIQITTDGSHPCHLTGEQFTIMIGRDMSWDEIERYKYFTIVDENGEIFVGQIYDWCSGSLRTCYYIYYSGTLPTPGNSISSNFNTDDMRIYDTLNELHEGESWKEYVVGIDSYADAKSIWETAHKSYLLNRVIRKASSDRSNLEYAVDLDKFIGSDTGLGKLYAYDYFNMFVEWSTRQKLQVSYNIPLTDDTVKTDLMHDVLFKDDIILPEQNEYGSGWVTGIKLDTKKDLLNVEITFETMFLRNAVTPGCSTITETGYSTVDIIETGLNTDTITEGECDNE